MGPKATSDALRAFHRQVHILCCSCGIDAPLARRPSSQTFSPLALVLWCCSSGPAGLDLRDARPRTCCHGCHGTPAEASGHSAGQAPRLLWLPLGPTHLFLGNVSEVRCPPACALDILCMAEAATVQRQLSGTAVLRVLGRKRMGGGAPCLIGKQDGRT